MSVCRPTQLRTLAAIIDDYYRVVSFMTNLARLLFIRTILYI
jgi:hypothetical protein